jgi:predicted oxidoreductase
MGDWGMSRRANPFQGGVSFTDNPQRRDLDQELARAAKEAAAKAGEDVRRAVMSRLEAAKKLSPHS